jgi:hypothetical protein
MKLTTCLSLASLALIPAVSQAAVLFSDNFDVNHTANWTVNNNNQGLNTANFVFDYSTLGIPSAPNSGGTTIGLKLGANTSGTPPAGGALSGISVSPTGQSFLGNYKVTFDWWHNFLGNATGGIGNSGGGSGSTQLSTFGVLTSGTTANYAGASDSVFFGADGDGASASDFRTYSSEKPTSYAVADAHNTYAAGSLNSSAALYQTLFPAGKTAPTQQTAISATQSGSTVAGMAGFAWNSVEIDKHGNIITWLVNGTLLATVDISNFTNAPSGNNILFGMADTSNGAGTPAALFAQLDFTLIDNVKVVEVIPEPSTVSLALLGLGAFAVFRRKSA